MTRVLLAALVSFAGLTLASTAASQARDLPRDQRVERARALFLEGLEAYEAGRLEVAAERLLASQRHWRSPETAFNIARCFERMGEARRGIHWFEVYLEHGDPDEATRADVEARIEDLREMLTRQQGQLFDSPPSRDELTEESRTFFQRGVAMYQREQYEAAMQAFMAAHRFAPFPELLYNMALTAERLEQLRDAVDYYREYLRMRPRSPDRAQVERRMAELRARR